MNFGGAGDVNPATLLWYSVCSVPRSAELAVLGTNFDPAPPGAILDFTTNKSAPSRSPGTEIQLRFSLVSQTYPYSRFMAYGDGAQVGRAPRQSNDTSYHAGRCPAAQLKTEVEQLLTNTCRLRESASWREHTKLTVYPRFNIDPPFRHVELPTKQ